LHDQFGIGVDFGFKFLELIEKVYIHEFTIRSKTGGSSPPLLFNCYNKPIEDCSYQRKEFFELVASRLLVILFATECHHQLPQNEKGKQTAYNILSKMWQTNAKKAGTLIGGHTLKVAARIGLLPAWLCTYRVIDDSNFKKLRLRYDVKIPSDKSSKAEGKSSKAEGKLRTFRQTVRFGLEEGLGQKIDDDQLEHGISKLVRHMKSGNDQHYYYLFQQQIIYTFSDSTIELFIPTEDGNSNTI